MVLEPQFASIAELGRMRDKSHFSIGHRSLEGSLVKRGFVFAEFMITGYPVSQVWDALLVKLSQDDSAFE